MATKRVVLGSGKLYVAEYTGSTIPEDSVIETDDNLIGYIQGGASLTYEPEFYTAEDDLGYVKKKILTNENVVLKSGIMTWNGKTLQKLCSTTRVTDDGSTRTVKIGGIENYDGKSYVVHFVYKDKVDGDVRVTIVGSNEAGFELAFAQDAETVIDAEFTALPCDDEGTLVILKETIA